MLFKKQFRLGVLGVLICSNAVCAEQQGVSTSIEWSQDAMLEWSQEVIQSAARLGEKALRQSLKEAMERQRLEMNAGMDLQFADAPQEAQFGKRNCNKPCQECVS